MSNPIGEVVTLDPARLREAELRASGGPPAGVVVPKLLNPDQPAEVLAQLAGSAGATMEAALVEEILGHEAALRELDARLALVRALRRRAAV